MAGPWGYITIVFWKINTLKYCLPWFYLTHWAKWAFTRSFAVILTGRLFLFCLKIALHFSCMVCVQEHLTETLLWLFTQLAETELFTSFAIYAYSCLCWYIYIYNERILNWYGWMLYACLVCLCLTGFRHSGYYCGNLYANKLLTCAYLAVKWTSGNTLNRLCWLMWKYTSLIERKIYFCKPGALERKLFTP